MAQDTQAAELSAPGNRREHKRHGVLIKVRLRDQDKLRGLYATDLSHGGLFVGTRAAFPIGQKLAIKLVHPLNGSAFPIGCEVVNVRHNDDGSVRGCGLKFRSFDEELKEKLFMFVEVLEPDDDGEEEEESLAAEGAGGGPPPDASPEALQAHALLLRALKTAHDGDLVGAAHLLARATALDPGEESLWEALHEVEEKLADAAIASADAAVARAEAQRVALVTEEDDLPPAPVERPSDVDDLTEEIDDLIEEDDEDEWDEPVVDWEEPVVYLEEPAELEPADRRKAKLLFDAAQDCYETRDIDDAIIYLKKAIGTDPCFAAAYGVLASVLGDEGGDLERALFLCNKAIDLEPRNDRWRSTLATLESKQG